MSLVRAARDGDIDIIVTILKDNPAVCVDQSDVFGETALLESIYHGNEDIALHLLQNGATPDLCRGDGTTPLHIACNKGRYTVAEYLLQIHQVRNRINCKNSAGNTALHDAVRKTQIDMIQLLVNHGASVNLKNKHGQRPIDFTKDIRVQRILRGEKFYEDLNNDKMVQRLRNGENRQHTYSPKTPKKKKRQQKNKNASCSTENENENKIENENANDEKKTNHTHNHQNKNGKKKKRKRRHKKLAVNNDHLNDDLKTWLDFCDDTVSSDTLAHYQKVYYDKKLRSKWLNYMQQIRAKNLTLIDYTRKMCLFADALVLELEQPQYEYNHYVPTTVSWYDHDDDDAYDM